MSQNVLHILHDILSYCKLAARRMLLWNFWGATVAPLCSCTNPFGPVPKGRWWLSWTTPGLAHMNQIWNANQMNGSIRFSSFKQSAPYSMCCEGDVHCGIWHCWGILHHAVPPRQVVNAAYYCTFLQHHLHPALRRNDNIWLYRTPSFFMTMQGVTPLLLSQISCAAGNGRFWNIHHTHPIWVHVIMISLPKWKNHCEGCGTTQEMSLSLL